MGKLLKVLGWLIGMIVILIVAAIILVPMFVDLNDHKDRIILEVKKATGRDLAINGEIGLSVFPRFALDLNGLSLSNAPGFAQNQFAAVKHVQIRVNMIPLLFRQTLEADTVVIDSLTLNLAKSKQGVTNWEDMLGKGGETSESANLPTGEESGQGGVLAFTIGGITIHDAQVLWDDQSTGERYEVSNLNLETGEIAPGRSVDINFNTELDSRKPEMKGQLGLTGRLQVDNDHGVFALDDLALKVKVEGEGLPAQGVEARLQSNIRYDQMNDVLDVKDLQVTSGALALIGSVEGHGLRDKPDLAGTLRLEKFSLREWLKTFGFPIPETADPEVLSALEFSSEFKAGTDNLKLNKMLLKLDQTVVKGDFELASFVDPAYLFDLNVDQINLDRYLPPASDTPASGGGAGKGNGTEELIPMEPLRKLRLDGKLQIDSLVVNNLHAEAVLVKLRGRDGKLVIDQQIGRFYDGLSKGSVSLDVTGSAPKMDISQSLSRVLAGPLLKDLMGDDKLLGSGNLELKLTSQGNSVNKIKQTLNGNLNFDFRDGAVKGFNLAQMIRDTRAKLSGESVAISNEPEQTDFSELNGSATIVNGLVNNQQLLAKSPYLRIEGSGKANLLQEDLDYSIRPVIVNTPKGQGGQGLEELVGVPIPVRIHGSWSDPQFNIQLAKVLEEQQKAKLKAKLDSQKEKLDSKVDEKLQEKVPEDLQDKLKDKFKKLF